MRLIAFVTNGAEVRKILAHTDVDCEWPHICPARGPPLWDECDAQRGDEMPSELNLDMAAQPASDYEVFR
jgi:hypothetical protein